MIKIGIISDTHNVLYDEVIEELKDCQYILHAGDFINKDILKRLKNITKVIAVKGNNDNLNLNEEEYFQIGNYTFYMTHQLSQKKKVDFYIYGHSHQLACYYKNHTFYINPGSCGSKRFSLPLTYVILYLYEHDFEIQIKELNKS